MDQCSDAHVCRGIPILPSKATRVHAVKDLRETKQAVDCATLREPGYSLTWVWMLELAWAERFGVLHLLAQTCVYTTTERV